MMKKLMSRMRKSRETTEINWNYEWEVYECARCHGILQYNFSFRVCPYCARTVTRSDGRRVSAWR